MINEEYLSHQAVLCAVAAKTHGPILELGCGYGSTPVLHGLCLAQSRDLHTLEENQEWLQKFMHFRAKHHVLRRVESWEDLPEYQDRWSVVFVDHGGYLLRGYSIQALANSADYIIAHDSCHGHLYGYENVLNTFTHRYDFTRWPPHTTVVSNFYRLSFLREL
jgi:hypothetical protein